MPVIGLRVFRVLDNGDRKPLWEMRLSDPKNPASKVEVSLGTFTGKEELSAPDVPFVQRVAKRNGDTMKVSAGKYGPEDGLKFLLAVLAANKGGTRQFAEIITT